MLLLLIACSQTPPTSAREIPADPVADSTAAADMLCRMVQQAKHSCTQDGNTLTLEEHSLVVTMNAKPGTWFPGRSIGMGRSATELPGSLTMDFVVDVEVDGQPMPAVSAKGRGAGADLEPGPARQQAMEKGLQLWGITTGVALVDHLHQDEAGLASLGEGSGALDIPGFTVTRGVAVQKSQAGLVGQEQAGRMVLDQGKMVTSLAQLVPQDGQLHGLRLDVGFDPNGIGCPLGTTFLTGDVEIDGVPSGKICEVADGYPWPKVSGVQGVEVFYLFAPQTAAPQKEAAKKTD
ncbi:MAG: hypothetical protein ACI9VR_004783 [Cognaticolwellia sp.]|jgi:hypothetical protein